MKLRKQATTVLTASAMAVSLLAGCTGGGKPAAEKPADAGKSGQAQEAAAGKNPVSDKPVTYKYMIGEKPEAPVKSDLPVLKELAKRTNVTFDIMPVPNEGYDEKSKILISTNEVPDFMLVKPEEMVKFGPDGAFLKLNDLIDKHAPNIKKLFQEHPDTKVAVTSPVDNGIYGLPLINLEPDQFFRSWMWRQDLAEEYGLKAPKDMNEFYQVLKTFKDKNPKSYPLVNRAVDGPGGIVSVMLGQFTGIIESTGGIAYNYKKKQYDHAANNPEFKDMLLYMNRLFKEELLDMEFASLKTNQWQERMLNNKSFVTWDTRTRPDYLTDQAKQANANTKYNVYWIPPFAAPSGVNSIMGRPSVDGGNVALSPRIKDPVTAVKLLDYIYSKEGQILMNYGVEGVSYTMKDGKPVPTEKYSTPTTSLNELEKIGASYRGLRGTLLPELAGLSERVKARDAMYKSYIVKPVDPLLVPTSKELEVLKEKTAQVNKFFEQETVKFIMGAAPITDDSIAKFKENYVKLGADEIVKVRNEQLKRAGK